jgi:hypothetical protein
MHDYLTNKANSFFFFEEEEEARRLYTRTLLNNPTPARTSGIELEIMAGSGDEAILFDSEQSIMYMYLYDNITSQT